MTTTTPRARKTAESPLRPADLKEWIAAVPPGVAIILPNGLTIDKRVPIGSPAYSIYPPYLPLQPHTPPSPVYPPYTAQVPNTSQQCPICNKWMLPNSTHYCAAIYGSTTPNAVR